MKYFLLIVTFILLFFVLGCTNKTNTIYVNKEKLVYIEIPKPLFTKCNIIVPYDHINTNNIKEIMIEDLLLLINNLSSENLMCYSSIKKIEDLQNKLIKDTKLND